MSRLHAVTNAMRTKCALGDQAFSARAKALPRFRLRDGARVLKAGSFESVTCVASSRIPDGSEVVSERDSVRAIFIARHAAFVVNT